MEVSPLSEEHNHLTPSIVLAMTLSPTLEQVVDHLTAICPQCREAADEALAILRASHKFPEFEPAKVATRAKDAAAEETETAARDLAELEQVHGTAARFRLLKTAPQDRFRGPVLIAECLDRSRAAGRLQNHVEAKMWAGTGLLVAFRTINPNLAQMTEGDLLAFEDLHHQKLALAGELTMTNLGYLVEAFTAVGRAIRQAGDPKTAGYFLDQHASLVLGVNDYNTIVPLDAKAEYLMERGAANLALRNIDAAIADFETSRGCSQVVGDSDAETRTAIYLAMALRHRAPERALNLLYQAIRNPLTPYLQASAVNEAVMILLLELERVDDAWELFQRYEETYLQCSDRGTYVCDRYTWALARFRAAYGDNAAALEHYGSLLERWDADTAKVTALNVALVVLEVAVIQLHCGAFDQVEMLANGSAATFAAAGLEANAAEAFELARSSAMCRRITVAELWRVHRYLRNPEALMGSYAVSS